MFGNGIRISTLRGAFFIRRRFDDDAVALRALEARWILEGAIGGARWKTDHTLVYKIAEFTGRWSFVSAPTETDYANLVEQVLRDVEHGRLMLVPEKPHKTEASSVVSARSPTQMPAPATPPPRKARGEKQHRGTLALVLDVRVEEEHDRPVSFRLESSDGAVDAKLFVDEDKVDAHGMIELRWHDLPENLSYTLTAKQADGDEEVLLEDRPFSELSAHTDDLDGGDPHTPITDDEHETWAHRPQ